MDGISYGTPQTREEYEKEIIDRVGSLDADDLQSQAIDAEMQVYDLSAGIKRAIDDLEIVRAWAFDISQEVAETTKQAQNRAALGASLDVLKRTLDKVSGHAI